GEYWRRANPRKRRSSAPTSRQEMDRSLAAFVGGAVGAGIASAVTTTTTVADTNTVRERIATITTDGGFNSGWHIHPGPVIVQVQDGYLKITQATCHPNVVGPGETYIETPGVPVIAMADKATM